MASLASIQNHPGLAANSHLAAEYEERVSRLKKKVGVQGVNGGMHSSVMTKMAKIEKPMVIKRKKKKGKSKSKKNKETADTQSNVVSGRNLSCHSKCKKDYENQSRSSVKRSAAGIHYGPMYQNPGNMYLDTITPNGSSQKQLFRRTSQGLLMSSTQENLKRSTSKKKKKTPKQQNRTNASATMTIHKTNKSMAALKNVTKVGDFRPATGRESSTSKKLGRSGESSKKGSFKNDTLRDSINILLPRYSIDKNSPAGNSRRTIPVASDNMYKHGLQRNLERLRIFEEAKAKKEQDELVNCTFKPNLSVMTRKKSSPE